MVMTPYDMPPADTKSVDNVVRPPEEVPQYTPQAASSQELLPWVTVSCRGVNLVCARSVLKNKNYKVRVSLTPRKETVPMQLPKAFVGSLKQSFGGLPGFSDILDPIVNEAKVWRCKTKSLLTLRHVSGAGVCPQETKALYAGGWEELVDYIVSIELIILEP
ncbi:hypothetical protein PHLGIDRAFT_131205 [Phlebiopsis gigantea 11061_1 CR5-6]|uniref:Uncharacterized protein n=1 Tax=Phlebiopsis gigantea (strain 11061_1 CR5-6) TaxID=745531 RepID=A0A0C3P9Y6_PHLG1|nr:hypothetical protein PHLGIDRAFT_131205 [Phlebiopsis gigantea 11061_1 CR5-6]